MKTSRFFLPTCFGIALLCWGGVVFSFGCGQTPNATNSSTPTSSPTVPLTKQQEKVTVNKPVAESPIATGQTIADEKPVLSKKDASSKSINADFEMKPGQTLEQVRDKIRSWRAKSPENAQKQVSVYVLPGTYYCNAPVEFGVQDGNVTFYGDGKAVFTRGKEITGWKVNAKGWFETTIPEVAQGKWWFDQLYVNHHRAVRAKSPNEFYYYIHDQVDSTFDPEIKKVVSSSSRAFIPRKSELPLFEKLTANDQTKYPLDDIQIRFFHSWASSKHRIQNYDAAKQTVLLTGGARWNLAYWGSGKLRYEIEGAPEFLDAPGEFLLDRKGSLVYIPRPGEKLENCTFFAPAGPKTFDESGFVRVLGNVEAIRENPDAAPKPEWYVANITFDGIAFRYDPFTLPPEGLSSGQAAINTPTSVLVEAAKNIVFRRCELTHVGGYAFWFHRACSGCTVTQCLIEDLGAGGVRIGTHMGGTDRDGFMLTREITVSDNIIRTYGQIEASAIGVWIGHGAKNNVVHNDISDGYYTGVSCGWVWGYAESPSVGNKIHFNRIHHIGQGVLSDMGGFYSLGISPGTSVSNNVIHDVYSYNRYGRGGWGLYTDEGSSNILFENNLVYRVHTGTVHQHYGQDNIFRNNILAFSLDGQIQRSRNEKHRSFVIENNIVLWDKSPLLASNWKENNNQFLLKDNLYWFCGTPTNEDETTKKFFIGKTLEEWQKSGNDRGSQLADPGFVDPMNGDFHFKGGKPNDAVKAIGFVPFDYSKAGIQSDTATFWGKRFSDFTYRTVRFAPDPPPAPPAMIQDDFEGLRSTVIPRATARTPLPVQNWKVSLSEIKSDGTKGKVLIQKNDIPFGRMVWTKFQWFGFCGTGIKAATMDIDNIAIRSIPADNSKDAKEKNSFVDESFDSLEKLPPKNLTLYYENVTDGISLLSEKSNKYLRLKDGPEYKAGYNPHFYYRFPDIPNKAVVSFDVRVSADAVLHTEAREYVSGGQYNPGPHLYFRDGKLFAGGLELGTVPTDKWVHVEMEFATGDNRVKPPYQIVKESDQNSFLRINDAAYFTPGFEPHFNYKPDHKSGSTAIGFKVRTAAKSCFFVEGRDASSPYRTAFQVVFVDNKITVIGKSVCEFQFDKWYQVDINLVFGTKKKWSLSISEVDAVGKITKTLVDKKEFPIQNQKWEELQWLGFVAAGVTTSHIDLDDIHFKNNNEK